MCAARSAAHRSAVPARRLDAGGRIDRARPVSFTFDGAAFEGFAGDTLASALLASGVDVVAPSPIQGRPRGVFSAGVEEPSAFVEVSSPRFDPIVPATTVDLIEGSSAHGRPGVGRLPLDPPPPPADHRHVHVETLVVGGGAAGIAAATAAAARGERVIVAQDLRGGEGRLPDDDAEAAATWLAHADDVTLASVDRRPRRVRRRLRRPAPTDDRRRSHLARPRAPRRARERRTWNDRSRSPTATVPA